MVKARPGNPAGVEDQKALALTKAALDCVKYLGLSPVETAAILGIQPGAFQALKAGKRSVDGTSGEAECADGLVRVTKRLQALLGASETEWRSWLRRENADLDGKPVEIMMQRYSVLKIASYLELKTSL